MSSLKERKEHVDEYIPRARMLLDVLTSKGPEGLEDMPYVKVALETLQLYKRYFEGERIDLFSETQRVKLKYEGHAKLPTEFDAMSRPRDQFEAVRGIDSVELFLEKQLGGDLDSGRLQTIKRVVSEPENFMFILVRRFERKYS